MMSTTSNKRQNTELSNGQDVSKRRRDRAGGNEELGLVGRREQCVRCISFVLLGFKVPLNTRPISWRKKGQSEIPRVNCNY